MEIAQLWSQFMENNPVLKLRIAQVQKLKFAQVHPNLVAREDALEYVEVGNGHRYKYKYKYKYKYEY